jgi:uncharacterized lipoprotein YajG
MSRLRHAVPKPAMIVAVVALVAALAGTAVASDPVASTSVTKKKTKQIAKRVANKAVNNALPIGSGELATIDEHTEIVSVSANSHQSVTASCESGETVLSGGFRWIHEGAGNLDVRASHREGNTWRANARNNTATAREFRVHAYCLTTG